MILRTVSAVAVLCAAQLCLIANKSFAHEVWIEDTHEGQLVVRFAEYGDDFEKSPGALDAMNIASAGLPAANPGSRGIRTRRRPLVVKKRRSKSSGVRKVRSSRPGKRWTTS